MGSLFIPYHVEGSTSKAAAAIRRWGLGGEREMFFSLAPRGVVESIATASGQCWGWRSVDIQGKPFLNFISPEDHGIILAALDQARAGAEAHGSMARFLGRDGGAVDLVFRFAPAEADDAVLGFARERIPRRAG